MKNKNFLVLVWVLLLSFYAESAAAFPKLQIQPIDLLGYVGKSLRISVTVPCGGEFYGLIASTNDKTKSMALAAAVSQESIVCTSMPSEQEVVISYLDVTGFKSIEPMTVQGTARLTVARISDMKLVKSKGKSDRLKVVYEPRCGRSIGTLIRQTDDDRLELAMVEKPATGMQTGKCSRDPAESEITSINTKIRKRVAVLRDTVKSLTRVFTLKLAPINPKSIRLGKNGGVKFKYKKSCNDAPLGVVVSDEKIVGGKKTALIGMLIANYYNIPCAGTKETPVWSTFKDATILVPAGVKLALYSTKEMTGLAVKAPIRISKQGKSGRKYLVLKHSATCGQIVGGVYSRDSQGGLSIGILTKGQQLSSNECKNGSGDVSLSQPYFIGHQRMEALFPLRLKGQSSR